MRVITTGLRFPEGPIALPNGDVLLVEIERGTLSRVSPEGTVSVVADCGGGPNGAAIGPDGAVYVCNNGGFDWHQRGEFLFPGLQPTSYTGGSIQRVDIDTGTVSTLYVECDGRPLKGPNDIVFDRQGGFYFTDLGKSRPEDTDRGALYYASIDGSSISCLAHPVEKPNGIGLSPTEDRLYWAETPSARLWYFDLDGPGIPRAVTGGFSSASSSTAGAMLANIGGEARLDSLAVDREGNVCVATLIEGVITAIAPDGSVRARVPVPEYDPLVTNICFGGPDLSTAYITSSGRGILYATEWFCPGLPLNFLNT
jgi:gluconolactonase